MIPTDFWKPVHSCSYPCQSQSEKKIRHFSTSTTTASKYLQIGAWHNSLNRMPAVILVSPLLNYLLQNTYKPKRLRICVNWNPHFHKIFKNCFFMKVNHHIHIELLNKFRSERSDYTRCRFWASWVCMYFDSVAVEIENCLLFCQIAINFWRGKKFCPVGGSNPWPSRY